MREGLNIPTHDLDVILNLIRLHMCDYSIVRNIHSRFMFCLDVEAFRFAGVMIIQDKGI